MLSDMTLNHLLPLGSSVLIILLVQIFYKLAPLILVIQSLRFTSDLFLYICHFEV